MAMRNARPGGLELMVALNHPNELFEAPGFDVANGLPPREAGIDRIRRELSAGSLRAPAKLVVEVPADQATPQVESGIKQAFARYCEAGIAHAEEELRAVHRDGWQTLLLGAILLAAGLLISEAILASSAPKGIRDFFGNGLFIVAAWVGMWYPLETLIYTGRPHRLERKLLRAMGAMEIAVRPAAAKAATPAATSAL
jgi:hypothetical protein